MFHRRNIWMWVVFVSVLILLKVATAQEAKLQETVTVQLQQGRALTQIQLDSDIPFNTESISVTVQGSGSFVAFQGFTNENKTLLVGISSEKSCFHVRITGATENGIGFVYDRWFMDACHKNYLPLITYQEGIVWQR